MIRSKFSNIGFGIGLALLGGLTGCVVAPQHQVVYAPVPPGYPETVVVVADDYIYYPGYQVYYSSNRRQYVYLEGSSWVSRPAPPRVSVDVLVASSSVRLDFHDAPAVHHASVVRQYPTHWAPPAANLSHGPGNKNNGKGNDRGDH